MKPFERKTIVSLIITIIFIVVLILVLMGKHNRTVNPIDGNQNGTEQVTGAVSIEPELISVAEDAYLYGIGGSYPQFPQAGALFNNTIKKTFTREIAEFKKIANDDYQARLAMDGADFEKQFAAGGMYSYEINTNIVQSNNQYISTVIRFGGYTGGAHGYTNIRTFNYDVANRKELSLSDLFPSDPDYLNKIASEARIQLTKKLTTAGNAELDENIQGMLTTGTDPLNPENYQNFTFTNESITIYFGEYQVAPYVFGEQSVTIPRT